MDSNPVRRPISRRVRLATAASVNEPAQLNSLGPVHAPTRVDLMMPHLTARHGDRVDMSYCRDARENPVLADIRDCLNAVSCTSGIRKSGRLAPPLLGPSSATLVVLGVETNGSRRKLPVRCPWRSSPDLSLPLPSPTDVLAGLLGAAARVTRLLPLRLNLKQIHD